MALVKIAFALTVLFLPLGGIAEASTMAVVKLTSAYSSSSIPARQGSGAVIQFRGARYVLTSDHVIYHSNTSFTHRLITEDGITRTLQYLISDAGRGLALLTSPDLQSHVFSSMPAIDFDVPVAKPVLRERFVLAGFPVESDAILVDENAVLSSLSAPNLIFTQLKTWLQVSGGQGEFGMSGGAGFSADGRYRGLISHQVIDQGKNTVLLISAEEVQSWLQHVVGTNGQLQKPSPISLMQDPAQQVSDFISFRTGPFFVTHVNPYAGKGPAGIHVLLSKSTLTETLFGGPQGAFASVLAAKDRCECQFRSLGFRKKEVLGGPAGDAVTLPMKLRFLLNPEVEPLWTLQHDQQSSLIDQVSAYQAVLKRRSQSIRFAPGSRLLPLINRLSGYLLVPPEDIDSYKELAQWRYVKPQDLEFILQHSSLQSEWQNLLGQSSDSSEVKALRKDLETLKTLFQLLTF